MDAMKSIMHVVRSDRKVQTLFWSMLVCIGLIISLFCLMARIV
jgi:hypothetical protein